MPSPEREGHRKGIGGCALAGFLAPDVESSETTLLSFASFPTPSPKWPVHQVCLLPAEIPQNMTARICWASATLSPAERVFTEAPVNAASRCKTTPHHKCVFLEPTSSTVRFPSPLSHPSRWRFAQVCRVCAPPTFDGTFKAARRPNQSQPRAILVPKSLVPGAAHAAARFLSALPSKSSNKAKPPRSPGGRGSNYRPSRHGHLNTLLDESRRLMARQLVKDWCCKRAPEAPSKPLSDTPS